MTRPLINESSLGKNNFDLLRLLLAITVIYSHCYVIYFGKTIDTEPFMKLSHNQMDLGGLAANCFFIISGFLITRSYERSEFSTYLFNRIVRIYPGYFVAFLISLLVVGPVSTINASHPFGEWLVYYDDLDIRMSVKRLLTIQKPVAPGGFKDLRLQAMVNEPLWTIQYEFISYLVLPVVIFLGAKSNRLAAVSLFFIGYAILLLQDHAHVLLWKSYTGTYITQPAFYPRFLTYFFSGSLFYLFREHIQYRMSLVILSLGGLFLACTTWPVINLIMPIGGSYLLFCLAYHPSMRFHNFAKWGDLSYGTYLYAWPVQQMILYFTPFKLGPIRLFILTLPFTLLVAYMSWHCVEKVFLNMKKKHSMTSELARK